MLELKRGSKAAKAAAAWFDENVDVAIEGLVHVAEGRGAIAEAALEELRDFKRSGHEETVRANVERANAARVRAAVLDFVEKTYAELDAPPPWLTAALATKEKTKAPTFVTAADLPPVVVDGRRLPEALVTALLGALAKSTFDEPHPLVAGLRAHGDHEANAKFAWRLFERWLTADAPSKDKWALAAIGHLGGDAEALELAKLVRAWPGEGQHQRAVLGLDCLRAIGTDGALMQLNGIAQKVKFKALQSAARAAMDEIAKARKMTRAELEDRIVPDCDLDERGHRIFDFGARKFHFVLGPEMKPMLRDESGKLLPDLPKPNAKDDAALAEATVAEWKLAKKLIKEVAKIQAERLEQAMVSGRRWKPAEAEMLVFRHPLLVHLARLLVFGGYDARGKLVGTFRIAEDGSYADASDAACAIGAFASIGVVHPLELAPAQREAWGTVLADYQIIPPFAQLGRAIHTLEDGETGAEITRFAKHEIASATLVSTLEKLGWLRGVPEDGGVFHEHRKLFFGANVTAVVEYPGIPVGSMVDWEDQTIERCFFVPGVVPPEIYPDHKGLALATIDPIVVSETLHDLAIVAEKAKA